MLNIRTRLKNDFDLAIITTVGFCCFLSLSPYAIFRLLRGDVLVAVIDFILLLITLFAVLISWCYSKTRQAGLLLASSYSCAAVLVAILLGTNGLFWFYCLILFNFFVVPPMHSVLATLTALAALCGYGMLHAGEVFTTNQQMSSFAVTVLVCSFFAFIFAWRTGQQRRRLAGLAAVDPLTGIGNRRILDREIDIALADFKRHGTGCGLLIMDLDHFKQVNDQFGHAEGGRVLIEFTRIALANSRRSDRLFRLGGEEFVLLLPNVDQSGLETAANNIGTAIEAQLRSSSGPVTVSIGGALLEEGDDNLGWLHKADVCLYRAKNEGRNRSVIHPCQ
ncbi:GGDEF domain-containing protein [Pseudomonas sp. MYb185]|uniref:GGDEF domain-containing protein n=1 Tax=Pseudomonas sp. MYb185 TaxID=1848729 RepID=UPI000CFD7764|nr:GGDEF domain-containing protein [Pseudomonas sp. MYb185]PRB74787.1 GGDEF domain-containing protein [Pseudomonas sp. MYb185]